MRAAPACRPGELNRFIEKITTQSPPVTAGKRNVRVMYASQTSVAPPTFVLFTNTVTKLHFSYERFLENRLRETYGFFGNPIRIQVRGRKDPKKARRTASERAPDRRKPVKRGPGSKPTRATRAKAAHAKQSAHEKDARKKDARAKDARRERSAAEEPEALRIPEPRFGSRRRIPDPGFILR